MRQILLYIAAFFLSLNLISCVTAETQSQAKHFNVKFTGTKTDSINVFLHQGAGKYKEVLPVEDIYSIDIPPMQGGYSSFLGIKFNVHNPKDYKIVKIKKDNKTIYELSINEIEKHNKDKKGIYLLKL